MHKLKIALVCRRYYPEIGGVETHVKEIAERFAKNNEVIVFTLSDKKNISNEFINGVNIKRFKSIKLSYSMEFPPESMVKAIDEFKPDIIHAHSVHTTIPYFASLARCGSTFIITPHYLGGAITMFRRILFALYKSYLVRAISAADRIICTSSIEREMFVRDFKPRNLNKIKLIPNGVDAELENIIPARKGLRILSVARLDLPHKKTDKLVRAFKILESKMSNGNGHDDGMKLVLVGNGPDKDKILKLIDDLNLGQMVELKSNLTKEELHKEYANASIFAIASEMENFNIAVSEALAAKLKVVVPNSTALASYVKDGYATGVELPVTPEKIAEAIAFCVQDNSKPMKQYSPYTWDRVAGELLDAYRDLLNEGKPLNRSRNEQKWSRI